MPRRLPAGWTWPRLLVLFYLVVLGASHATRLVTPVAPVPIPGEEVVEVEAVRGRIRLPEHPVRVRYRELGEAAAGEAPLLLLHGSPGAMNDLGAVAALLAGKHRVLLPDLPGFGRSGRDIPDYSIRAHAIYVEQMLERLDVESVHVVAFSMAGGVALELNDAAPGRVQSLTMLSATGVQELELFGDHALNRAVHALQLWFFRGLRDLVPHFGALDGAYLGVEFARNFYDSDQRPLRGILERFEPPMLILHGGRDPLVPAAAAREHHRIVPHSELSLHAGRSHFLPFVAPRLVADEIGRFVARVQSGEAPTRDQATAERLGAAAAPFDASRTPAAEGLALVVLLALIVGGTLVSEDLTCIAAGLLVSQGRIGFAAATLACFVGIFLGDVLLYFAGRLLGRPLLALPPFRWVLDAERLERTTHWLERRGAVVIGLSRFLPGLRLPTYVAAGILRTRFLVFAFWFLVAAGLWTPLFVGAAALAGPAALRLLGSLGAGTGAAAIGAAVALLLLLRAGVEMITHRGRRRLYGAWRRWTRWEFWPPWLFYPPVVVYVLLLGLRFRGPTLFTAANPAMPAGGFIGESKGEILGRLQQGGAPVARFETIQADLAPPEKIERARDFMRREGLQFPVVVKPDVGQRGEGVEIVRTPERLQARMQAAATDLLLQAFAAGRELGVFYHRHPDDARGRILAITDKRLPVVTGDGERNLEMLIRDDARGAVLVRAYLRERADRLEEVPAAGEEIALVDVGTHCRGAVFLDGGWAATESLEAAVDRISQGLPGFFFGRYDLIAPDDAAFRDGRDLTVIELNGVTSEATNIYDPKNGLLVAYRILFRQWRRAFEIGAANRDRGVRPTPLREILGLIRARFRPPVRPGSRPGEAAGA